MHPRPRIGLATLRSSDVPESAGVYALYRGEAPMYVGKAANLRKRVWSKHLGMSKSMRGSALRRNVAEHLGIAEPNAIYIKAYRSTAKDLVAVRGWMEGCHFAWIECATDADAIKLENDFKDEYRPPLTKT